MRRGRKSRMKNSPLSSCSLGLSMESGTTGYSPECKGVEVIFAKNLKGLSTPLSLYREGGGRAGQGRFEVAIRTGLTPLVGRDSELGLLKQRWERAKAGEGQVVLLSGEPGIGKSRLMQELKEQVVREEGTRIEFRCSPH